MSQSEHDPRFQRSVDLCNELFETMQLIQSKLEARRASMKSKSSKLLGKQHRTRNIQN